MVIPSKANTSSFAFGVLTAAKVVSDSDIFMHASMAPCNSFRDFGLNGFSSDLGLCRFDLGLKLRTAAFGIVIQAKATTKLCTRLTIRAHAFVTPGKKFPQVAQ